MSGFFDRVKDAASVFVVLDEDGQPQAAPADAQQRAPLPPQAPEFTPVGAAPPADATQLHPASAAVELTFVDDLRAAVQAGGRKAYDQFKTLYDALNVPDDAQRTQLALAAVAAANQVAAADVVAAIDGRMELLAKERGAFQDAIAAQTEASVAAGRKTVAEIREQVAAKQAEIRDLEARRARTEAEIAQAQADIDASRQNFAASYAVVETELARERARVAAHLTPAAPR